MRSRLQNDKEARVVAKLVSRIPRVRRSDVVALTPYLAQRTALQE